MSNSKNITSANQAYKNFLEENGQATLPKEQQISFKDWLNQVKTTGQLSGLLPAVKESLNQKSDEKYSAETTVSVPKKPFRPLGMHPVVFTVGTLVVISLVAYAGYNMYKGFKNKQA